ncbi:MAG: T9SS type A sorting domain-containing protein, partial [Bacteroidota bacterium]
PYFDFSTASHDTLSFWQNYNNEPAWDGMRVEYDINTANNWQVLGTVGDTLGTNWYNDADLNSSLLPAWTGNSIGWEQSKYDLSGLGNPSIVQFRFVFTSDAAVVADGHSIDDFSITTAYQNDLAVTGVTSPGLSASTGSPTNLNVNIYNAGLNPTSAFNIYYSLNGGTPVAQNYSSPISSFTLVNVNLNNIIPISGVNTLKIYTDWASDLNRVNDTLYYSFTGEQTFTIPYSNDFEVADADWSSVPSVTGTAWAWGSPAFGATTGAHGGTACWDVNLTSPYNNTSSTYLVSPAFNYINTTLTHLSCWINYNTEFGGDGCIIEYSFDDATWQTLGVFNDPSATNWYNDAVVGAFLGQPAWSGNSNSWQQITYNTALFDEQPYVRLRFSFRSDVNLSGDGISMDDFSLTGTVGIDNPENKQSTVLVYPNPAGNVLYIKTQGTPSPQITMMNASGQMVLVKKVTSASATTQLDISTLPAGIYLIKVISNENVSFHKVVVE